MRWGREGQAAEEQGGLGDAIEPQKEGHVESGNGSTVMKLERHYTGKDSLENLKAKDMCVSFLSLFKNN